MTEHQQKEVCLLMNLGGIEMRIYEYLSRAQSLGKTVYSLTGDGLWEVDQHVMVPANVMKLTPAELLIWSSMINEEIKAKGIDPNNAYLLAGGKNKQAILPLGIALGQGIRLGA